MRPQSWDDLEKNGLPLPLIEAPAIAVRRIWLLHDEIVNYVRDSRNENSGNESTITIISMIKPHLVGWWVVVTHHIVRWQEYTHCSDVIMGAMASQITSIAIVYSTVYSDADQRKHQRAASLASVRGIHRWPVNSPHKWLVTRKIFPFDDVIRDEPVGILKHKQEKWCILIQILIKSLRDATNNKLAMV